MTKPSRKEFAAILVLIGVLVLVGFQFGRTFGEVQGIRATMIRFAPFLQERRTAEIAVLAKTYGPSRYSEHAEEWIVRDFFKNERDGVFVDVGANHHQFGNNTYYLETVLGWSGVAIEPQTTFEAGYKRYRPRTTFVPVFVSDVSNQHATLYETTTSDNVASGVREFTESFGEVTATPVTTSTLDDVLDRLGIKRIDLLSMDIELAEPQALTGFSIARFAPRLVTIEAHAAVRQQILDYFERNQYVLVGRYWQTDDENFWFAPAGHAGDGAPLVTSHLH
jgi:FkbM family methyltransferase